MASPQTPSSLSLCLSLNPKNCSALFLNVFQTPEGDSCKSTLKLFFLMKVETSVASFFLHSMSMCSVLSIDYFTMKTWHSFIKAVTWFVSVTYKCAPWCLLMREHFKDILNPNHFEHARHFLFCLVWSVCVRNCCKHWLMLSRYILGVITEYMLHSWGYSITILVTDRYFVFKRELNAAVK